MKAINTLRASAIIVLAIALALALAGCAGNQGSPSAASSTASDSPSASQAKLAIIHTNDTHGYDQASDKSLGMAAVAQLKSDYQAQGYDVLLFDAGDAFSGNLLADDSKGTVIPKFMNQCGYDAMALGNHDFDFGADVLIECMNECSFPVLAANITVEETGDLFAKANTVFTLSDGTKVGVFGIDTPETMTKSSPKNSAGLKFAQDEDLYKCAQQQIDELRGQGCEIVVCLGHFGEDESSAPNRASDVVANTEGIDLFIDGHDHQVENAIVKDKAGSDVLVVETGCYLANIGVVKYESGTFEETLVAVGEYDGADADVDALVDSVESDIDERMSQVIGSTAFDMNGEASPGNRTSETNLGDFFADALFWEVTQATGTEPDCSIVNGGAIRTSIATGDITMHNVHDVYPFSNQVYSLQVTGAQLLEALEAACQDAPEPMGSFPQVSHISFTLNTAVPYEKGDEYPYSTYYKPANPGSRVTITDVNGKGFDPEATYTVATSDFIAYGGDTYYCFAEAAHHTYESTGYQVYQAMQYYLTDECGGTVPDEYASPQGRITFVES